MVIPNRTFAPIENRGFDQYTVKHFLPIEPPVKDNQTGRDLIIRFSIDSRCPACQLHKDRKQYRRLDSCAKQPQCTKLMTMVKLRLIRVACVITMIFEKMESKLSTPRLYRVRLIVNVDPVAKTPLSSADVEQPYRRPIYHGKGISENGNPFSDQLLDKYRSGWHPLAVG